jgi:hypothetical protein
LPSTGSRAQDMLLTALSTLFFGLIFLGARARLEQERRERSE